MKRFSGACAANRPWSDEDRAELLKRRRTGESTAEIAQAMNRSERAITSMACKLGLPVVRKPHRLTELAQVRRLAERGYSDRVIGLTIGRSRSAVSQIRDKYKIKAGTYARHRRWHYTKVDIEVIRHCYATSDAPVVTAAKMLGRTRTAIQALACKLGMTRGRA